MAVLETRQLRGPAFDEHAYLTFSPDSKWLGCSSEGAGSLWEVEIGRLIGRFDLTFASELTFSPDSSLVAGPGDGVGIWTLDGELVSTAERNFAGAEIYDIRFDPTGRLITIALDQRIGVWDIAENRYVAEYTLPTNETVLRVRYSDKGLIAISLEHELDHPGGNRLWARILDPQEDLFGIPCTTDRPIIAGDASKAIICDFQKSPPLWRVWDLVNGQQMLATESHSLSDPVFGFDERLALNRSDRWHEECLTNYVEVWNLRNGKLVRSVEYPYRVANIACAPNHPLLAIIANYEGDAPCDEVAFFSIETGERLGEASGHQQIGMSSNKYAFSPDGRWFASAIGELHLPYQNQSGTLPPGTILLTNLTNAQPP